MSKPEKPSSDLDRGLGPNMQKAIIQTNADLIHRCIHAALGGAGVKLVKTYLWFSHVDPKLRIIDYQFMGIHTLSEHIIKSPRYTGGDFMFLYWFVWHRRPQIVVHAITFQQFFGFLSFLAWLLITWLDFGRYSLWPWPSNCKVKYGSCYISVKNCPIATKQKANILLEL